MVNASLIVFMIVTIALLFTAMVLSAMASSDATKGTDSCKKNCHKYSMWSALVTGIAVACIVVILIIYIYTSRKDIASSVHGQLGDWQSQLGAYAGVGQPQMPSK